MQQQQLPVVILNNPTSFDAAASAADSTVVFNGDEPQANARAMSPVSEVPAEEPAIAPKAMASASAPITMTGRPQRVRTPKASPAQDSPLTPGSQALQDMIDKTAAKIKTGFAKERERLTEATRQPRIGVIVGSSKSSTSEEPDLEEEGQAELLRQESEELVKREQGGYYNPATTAQPENPS